MIKQLKLQKAFWIIILGVIVYIVGKILESQKTEGSVYVKGCSGVLFIIGAFWLLYPIVFTKKPDKEGNVELFAEDEKEG